MSKLFLRRKRFFYRASVIISYANIAEKRTGLRIGTRDIFSGVSWIQNV